MKYEDFYICAIGNSKADLTDTKICGEIISSIIMFSGCCLEGGLFNNEFELPGDLKICYFIDFYIAQVNNGGHAQFYENSRYYDRKNFDDTRVGFNKMKSIRHKMLFDKLLTIVENLEAGASLWIDALDKLDVEFYNLENTEPLDCFLAEWIFLWDNLRLLTKVEFKKQISTLFPDLPAEELTRMSGLD